MMIKKYLNKMRGGEKSPPRIPLHKMGWSWLGAFLGIYSVSAMHSWLNIDMLDSLFLVGSFGATAVLVYAVPQAELSQPRNLLGGHIISALIGVTIYKYIPLDVALLSALAVSLSIITMQYTRTLHPPGGATALIAVIGSDSIHELGYFYVLSPIAIGAFIMLLVALIINNLSSDHKRHYPRYWI